MLLKSIFLLFVMVVTPVFSQTYDESSLWIKPSILERNKEKDSLETFLNYHSTVDFNDRSILSLQKKLNRDNTYFIVFKERPIDSLDGYIPSMVETVFAEFHYNGSIFKVSENYFHSDKVLRLKKGDFKTGMLLNYSGSFERKPNKNINFTFIRDKKNIALYEVLIIPSRLPKEKKAAVQTYLSVKYGVSLDKGQDYMSNDKTTLWEYEKNKKHSNRITGLGREDFFGLYQKQTQNSTDSLMGMSLGSVETYNNLNKEVLQDKSYLIYGDNGNSLSFEKVDGKPFEKLKRSWKFLKTRNFETDSLHIRFDPKQLSENWKEEDFYLYMNNSESNPISLESLKVVKGVFQDSILVFKGTELGKTKYTEGYFTIYKKDRFEAETKYVNDCEAGDYLNLKIIGGVSPYDITIKGADTEIPTWNRKVSNKESVLKNLPTGEGLSLAIKDAVGNRISIPMTSNNKEEIPVFLNSSWNLENNGGVLVSPWISEEISKNDLQFEWRFKGEVVGTQEQLTAIIAGDYSLKVSSKMGCVILPFQVQPLTLDEKETPIIKGENGIYPNPVKAGEEFTIKVNLPKTSDLRINIYTLKGQFLHSKTFLDTDYVEYQNTLNTAGVYLVILKSAHDTQILKLVVK